MAKLEFESLEFTENKDFIEVALLNQFYFKILKSDLDRIGKFTVGRNHVEFNVSEKQASQRFNFLISEGISNLRNKLNGKPSVYIHKNSGIPLIGNLFFGIVDRGTSIIEIKPLTSCNLNCIFCSVDEGISSRKSNDFVVEEEYLVQEFNSLLDYKKCNVEVFINPHGEPLLYADLVRLVKDLKKNKYVKKISIATNGALLSEKLINDLEKAGLDQFNCSVSSLDKKTSMMMAGTKDYDIDKIKKNLEYIASRTRISLILAPVWVPGINDKDIEDMIIYSKEIGCEIGIQKYISHKKGRNPKNAKEMEWNKFFKELDRLEGISQKKLVLHGPARTKELPKPFKTGDIIEAKLMCNGRNRNEKIAVAGQRSIIVYDCNKDIGDTVNIKIIKSKSNIFFAKSS